MKCASCQAEAGAGPTCGACGALQPLPPGIDSFAALGLPRTWFLETSRIEDAFKDLNRRLHPDRFAQRPPRERRLSLEWTTAVNDAWRKLRDPVRRAVYLLKLEGLDVEKESGAAGGLGQLPFEVLEEVMEQREALAAARKARDLTRVRALADSVRKRSAGDLDQVAGQLRAWETTHDRAALQRAGATLAVLKYHQRFLEEAEAIELEALDQP